MHNSIMELILVLEKTEYSMIILNGSIIGTLNAKPIFIQEVKN